MTSASVFFLGKSTILQNAFVMYVMKLRIHHILQCHFVIQKIQYILLKKKRGLLLNMTISLDTGLLPGHCSSLPKRSERRKALYKSEEKSRPHATFQILLFVIHTMQKFDTNYEGKVT